MECILKRNISALSVLWYVIGVAVILFGIFGGLLVNESTAVDAVDKVGFTEYQIVSREWFLVFIRGCSRDDQVKFNFTAKDQRGKTVSGYVCAGVLKGPTLRIPQ